MYYAALLLVCVLVVVYVGVVQTAVYRAMATGESCLQTHCFSASL